MRADGVADVSRGPTAFVGAVAIERKGTTRKSNLRVAHFSRELKKLDGQSE